MRRFQKTLNTDVSVRSRCCSIRTIRGPDHKLQPMHIDCPHCHNPIEVVDENPASDVTCSSCGSQDNTMKVWDSRTETPELQAKIDGRTDLGERRC